MSLLVLAMTVVVILVEDRIPVPTVLLFAVVVFVPALAVDLMVLWDRPAGSEDRPRPRRRRRRDR